MPKEKRSLSILLKTWRREIKVEDIYTIANESVFCQPCTKKIVVGQKTQLVQHNDSVVHKKNLAHWKSKGQPRQDFVDNIEFVEDLMPADLVEAFLSADIPLSKLENTKLKGFLEKHIGRSIPSERTARRLVKPIYDKAMEKIVANLEGKKFWISVDETRDSVGRNIVIVIAGALEEKSTPFVISCSKIEKTNHSTIAAAVNKALRKICLKSEEEIEERFVLLTTDSVNYMKKAGQGLQILYPKLIHVTCLAHALHLLSEVVRNEFPLVNELISNVKQIFSKAPNRIEAYKEMLPELPLPPEPVIIRWGTWLNAAKFYSENIEGIERVVSTFQAKDSTSISKVQKLFEEKKQDLVGDLASIHANYSFLPQYIKILEDRNILMPESLDLVEKTVDKLLIPEGSVAEKVLSKLIFVLTKNSGLSQMKEIRDILNGKKNTGICKTEIPEMEPTRIACMKYAPLTSVEVERSFSRFKNILADKRTNLTLENLEFNVICNCFFNHSD